MRVLKLMVDNIVLAGGGHVQVVAYPDTSGRPGFSVSIQRDEDTPGTAVYLDADQAKWLAECLRNFYTAADDG